MNSDEIAIEWGQRLFEYYRSSSKELQIKFQRFCYQSPGLKIIL
ncbi:transcriptional regulator FilR1 domain-containing protein [Methanolacinia petrolearia]